MAKEALEKVIEHKVKPILDDAMHKALGITVAEIESDISDRLKRNPLLDIPLNTKLGFKKAKEFFKKHYLQNLLESNFGNVSRVAEIAEVDRRSVHRLINSFDLNVPKFRQEMLKSSYLKQIAVQQIIENALETYKTILHPSKIELMYKEAPHLSKEIIKELPDQPLSLKEAEDEFEKLFLEKALKENNNNQMQTAKAIGLRYETLHRKMKSLGII